jgi:UDP-perosamine 4-acetyltransferase
MKARGFAFSSVQDPSAVMGRECEMGEGCQVMAGAVLQCRVKIGSNAVINTRSSVDHDCTIGPHAFISPGATLCGNVTLAESAFVGAGAVVLPGIGVGESAIVGAGAVVTKPVPTRWIVAGNPAVKIGTIE